MLRLLAIGALLLSGSLVWTTARQPARKGQATPYRAASSVKGLKDFVVEQLYAVPEKTQGSWVSMCTDPKGRLIVSDQYGGLFRVTPPAFDGKPEDTKVEKIEVPLGEAQGLLWAFDSLYVVVNRGSKFASGLYRVRDTDGDDRLDRVELLRKIDGGGEHGPHAVILTPGGKSLTIVCGNGTRMMSPLAASRVPRCWGEDHLLERLPDGNNFMAGVLGPGGCIYKVDPEGKNWELLSTGFRNEYDAAYNRHGDLITYDADMEWDMNTPWYRPTRVCHATSGSEFGWRNGAGKWPAYYLDNLPGLVDIGPGSPTGVCFGYGAKFPAKYQDAFFICDWSYGKLYAIHLTPDQSSYKGEIEEFVSGTPLALTDLVINPVDGAMYFAVGGRKSHSALYRVRYVGKESTAPSKGGPDAGTEARALRHRLETFHRKKAPAAIEAAWPHLGHSDRYLRFAARVALEHQDPAGWRDRALAETNPAKAIPALLALTRVSAADPFHRKADSPVPGEKLKAGIFASLSKLDGEKLTDEQRLDLLRVWEVALNRMGPPEEAVKKELTTRLDRQYPARSREMNAELCALLVYLEAPGVVEKTLKMMAEAPTQEEQMEYARSLRVLKTGWTLGQRQEYFRWFVKAGGFRGGNSLGGFLSKMKTRAMATLSEAEKAELKPILDMKPISTAPIVGKPRPFVKKWSLDEALATTEKSLGGKRDYDRGRRLFAEAKCFVCHRFASEGGAAGPDLTGLAGRFSVRDLLDSIVNPSKVISDQYAAVQITTTDGKVVTGRIVNLDGANLRINTDMLDPNALIRVNRSRIETQELSKVSMMPEGLLDTLHADEVGDLMAFLLSRGDRNSKMFR